MESLASLISSAALQPRLRCASLGTTAIRSKDAFPFSRIGLDEPSPMRIRTIALLSLTILFSLELSGREPIKSPPPGKQLADAKVVRARDLGVPFDGTPGKLNSITDVPGVEVGYTT